MKKIILALFVLATVASCKKDDDKTCDYSQANFAGTYKVTAAKYKANTATAEVDEFATWDACQKDDLIVFNSNSSINYQDAGSVCTPSGNDTGIWAYTSSNTVNVDGEVYSVASFNCSGATLTQIGTAAGELYTIVLARQ